MYYITLRVLIIPNIPYFTKRNIQNRKVNVNSFKETYTFYLNFKNCYGQGTLGYLILGYQFCCILKLKISKIIYSIYSNNFKISVKL